LKPADFEALGIFDFAGLGRLQRARGSDLVEGLIRDRSVNLFVGDSGLGKTPLAVLLGVCVASGRPFLGRPVRKGRVLYCDAESGVREFRDLLQAVSRFVGLEAPPSDFLVWSPDFDSSPPNSKSLVAQLKERVLAVEPLLVIPDPFRAIWPSGSKDAETASAALGTQRELTRLTGCSWLNIHHRRKRDATRVVSLEGDKRLWFQEAAGSLALINHTDTRLGFEESSGPADLLLAGFARGLGWLGSFPLQRVLDDDGTPEGYRVLTGIDHLSQGYQEPFKHLPDTFGFKRAKEVLGGHSDSNTAAFLSQCQTAGLVRKEGREYVKVAGQRGVGGA
jgi:hypothetical protein